MESDLLKLLTIPAAAGGTYGAFHWLDQNLSQEAKHALTKALRI
jgi:hypothetical protein